MPVRIGHLAIQDAGAIRGDIDDVATWSRALSAGEINLIYAAARKPAYRVLTGEEAARLAPAGEGTR